MTRVRVSGGKLIPLDPMPMTWSEGREFAIEETTNDEPPILPDQYWEELERSIAVVPQEEFDRFEKGLAMHRQQQKELMRRRMELS